jgi:hypothetical protein
MDFEVYLKGITQPQKFREDFERDSNKVNESRQFVREHNRHHLRNTLDFRKNNSLLTDRMVGAQIERAKDMQVTKVILDSEHGPKGLTQVSGHALTKLTEIEWLEIGMEISPLVPLEGYRAGLDGISELKELKYLKIECNFIYERALWGIYMLPNLKTLDLTNSIVLGVHYGRRWRLRELPARQIPHSGSLKTLITSEVREFTWATAVKSLEHIEIWMSATAGRMQTELDVQSIGTLPNLETLLIVGDDTTGMVGEGTLYNICQIANLRKLEIRAPIVQGRNRSLVCLRGIWDHLNGLDMFILQRQSAAQVCDHDVDNCKTYCVHLRMRRSAEAGDKLLNQDEHRTIKLQPRVESIQRTNRKFEFKFCSHMGYPGEGPGGDERERVRTTLASWNINKGFAAKIEYILWMCVEHDIDMIALSETRQGARVQATCKKWGYYCIQSEKATGGVAILMKIKLVKKIKRIPVKERGPCWKYRRKNKG